jgi:hypothetical protein
MVSVLEHGHADLRSSSAAHRIAMLVQCSRRQIVSMFEIFKIHARRGKDFADRWTTANKLPIRRAGLQLAQDLSGHTGW